MRIKRQPIALFAVCAVLFGALFAVWRAQVNTNTSVHAASTFVPRDCMNQLGDWGNDFNFYAAIEKYLLLAYPAGTEMTAAEEKKVTLVANSYFNITGSHTVKSACQALKDDIMAGSPQNLFAAWWQEYSNPVEMDVQPIKYKNGDTGGKWVESGWGFKAGGTGCFNLVRYNVQLEECNDIKGDGIPDCECAEPREIQNYIEDDGIPDGDCPIKKEPEAGASHFEIKVSKTQTCAINETLGQNRCDPASGNNNTAKPTAKPNEFTAIDPNPNNIVTQLARPGDSIRFEHRFDKGAQKLYAANLPATWVSVSTRPVTDEKCKTSLGSFWYDSGGMPGDSKECIKNPAVSPNPNPAMENSTAQPSRPINDFNTGSTAKPPTLAAPNVYAISDQCQYTGRQGLYNPPSNSTPTATTNLTNISLNTVKTGIPALGNLAKVPSCANNAELETATSATATVQRKDVGSKEVYQRVTLYDRVAEYLQNCKNKDGDCKGNYKRQGLAAGATDTNNNTGEDWTHTVSVRWKNKHSDSCSFGGSEYCSACSASTNYWGSGSGNCSCGCSGCSCSPVDGPQDDGGTYVEHEHSWVKLVDAGPVSSNAQFNIPYNYKLTPVINAKIPSGSMLSGGSDWDYETWVNVESVPNGEFPGNAPYATITRPDTTWKITEFYVDENQTTDPNPNTRYDTNGIGHDPCNSYSHATSYIQNVADNCRVIQASTGPLNDDDNAAPRPGDAHTNHTAHIADAPAGTKFCIGLSVVDYQSRYDDGSTTGNRSLGKDTTYGDALHNRWIHIKPVCVSISKSPTMQVWGGGLYSEGKVTGRYTEKLNATTSPYSSSWIKDKSTFNYGVGGWKAFGSWSEYDAIGSNITGGNSRIKTFGSAAAFGQGLNIGQPFGGGNTSVEGCSFTKLHIKNANPNFTGACSDPRNGNMGNSTAFRGLADRIALRYTNRVSANKWITGDSANIYDNTAHKSGNWTGGSINPRDYISDSHEITYFHASGNASINGGDLPIQKGKTVIVEVDQKATITGNITYTDEQLSSIHEIPQVLIFADEIDIEPQVTQVDAWLMVGLNGGSGVINTCSSGVTETTLIASNGKDTFGPHGGGNGPDSEKCRNRLKINGPVQAKQLKLLRSWGAGMGLNCPYNYTDGAYGSTQWPNGGKTSPCGNNASGYGSGNFPYDSATPAEVFNLRADAYLWAYKQTENYSQAFVTYQREVAPRL
jgi:hypothetical protein